MCDASSETRAEAPAGIVAFLTAGFLTGLIAAAVLLARGDGLLAAFAAYSGVGGAAVVLSAGLASLRDRPETAMAETPDGLAETS